jgi:leader peptidase (prepilin peptidase) / N-methyltransferase
VTIGGAVVGVLLSTLIPSLHGYSGEEWFAIQAMRSSLTSITGVLIGSALVLWIALLAETILKKEAMGFGDVKFVGMIGAFCGWQGGMFAIFGGAIVGTVWIVLALLWQTITGRKPAAAPPSETPEGEATELRFGAHVPFGPMLAVAAAIYFLAAAPWLDAYLRDVAEMF